MEAYETNLPGVLEIKAQTFNDRRGYFREVYQQKKFEAIGIDKIFVQDNLSRSEKGVLRGLHFQEPCAQGKLIQVVRGEIFDVAVDIRQGSPHFGNWVGLELSDAAGNMLWVPEGFAHGFVVLSDSADVIYKVTEYWAPESERVIRWDDPDIGIDWPTTDPILVGKDLDAPALAAAAVLPQFRP
ncbi:MAG: dTDP-4-dehydrorhamnose 3,5-epimerase [Rhodospirillales bacterium]|nr:dTDP-4-dehydrorhamnose 3,5-epimerase [Rhodospirillales bacterium]